MRDPKTGRRIREPEAKPALAPGQQTSHGFEVYEDRPPELTRRIGIFSKRQPWEPVDYWGRIRHRLGLTRRPQRRIFSK